MLNALFFLSLEFSANCEDGFLLAPPFSPPVAGSYSLKMYILLNKSDSSVIEPWNQNCPCNLPRRAEDSYFRSCFSFSATSGSFSFQTWGIRWGRRPWMTERASGRERTLRGLDNNALNKKPNSHETGPNLMTGEGVEDNHYDFKTKTTLQ